MPAIPILPQFFYVLHLEVMEGLVHGILQAFLVPHVYQRRVYTILRELPHLLNVDSEKYKHTCDVICKNPPYGGTNSAIIDQLYSHVYDSING